MPFNKEYPEMTCSCLPITVVVLVRDVAETPLVRHPTARSVAFVVVVVVVAIARAPGRLARAVVVVSSVAFAVAFVARGAAGSLGGADEGGTVIARGSHQSRVGVERRVSRRRVRHALFRFDSMNE
jgi:hypothetical protein